MAKAGESKLIAKTKDAAAARHKARYGELVALIKRRMVDVVESFYDIGEALREIVEKKLYVEGGHKNLGAFLRAEGIMSISRANRLIAVVRKVPRDDAMRLGQERAYALLAYTEATPDDDSPSTLLASDARIKGTPAAAASVRDIQRARREVVDAETAKRPPTDAERKRVKAKGALEAGARKLLREAGLRPTEIHVGRASVRVTLDLAQLERRLAKG